MASTPYKHFVPPVPLNPDYDKNFTYVLIETLDQLKDSFQKGVVIAWDTETTGLNPVESEIVGFSYSYDGQTGYYCPVKHFDLALGKPALDLFYQALKDAKLQLLYNARFDIRMMEYSGYDMSFLYPKNPDTNLSQAVFIDVMNQVWLADTNIPLPSLKSSTLHFLGYQPPKFLETLGDEQNFKYVPAKDAYRYACFTADTLIQTKHGLKQISELKPNVDLIKTSDGYHRLLNVLDQGVQKVIRVSTPIGTSFTCTPDHKFAMEIDHCICWVEAKDLDKISFHKRYCGGQSLYEIEKCYTPSPMVMDDGNACKIEYVDEPQPVFDLTIEDEHNFFLQCGLIAHNCLDAINTMNLFKVTYRFYKESGKAAQLDNACVYIIGQLEKTPLNIDTDYLVDLRDKVYSRVLELEQEIYSIAGHPFKIGSNRELTLVFQEHGIDTGERTKAGDMKTGIELLNMYLRNHPECTLLKLLIEYKEQFKFYNSYLKTLVDIAKKQDTVPPRFSYKLQSVPCLTENNLVLIRDKGITYIPEVKEQDYIWTQYGYKRVLWCNSHKTEDVYRVTFENAVFIEGTAHHPVLVNKGTEINPELEWATLESLKEGERVIFNHHTPPLQYSDDPKEKELSKYLEYLGYLIAVNIEPSVQYQVDWIETRDDLFKQASNEFRQMTHTITSNPGYLFDLVIKSKPYQWIHFLQGIFFSVFETPVAQTWNNSNMDEFILRSQTPLLLTFLMNILSYLGIPTSLAYDDDSFFIIFNTSQSLTLLKTLIITDSNSHYLKSLFQNYNPFNYFIEYADSKVKAKEKMEGEHTVYDIEVEDVHEYVANGIVTHNTGRLATGKDGKNTYFAPINLQCLEENTLIKTERGNIPIKNVTEKDLVWTGTRFVPCKPLGSKQKECFKIKTLWGEIEASLEHRFLTINIYDDYKIEWHTLAECISRKLPLVKDPQSLGIQFDDLYNHPTYSVIGNLRKELDLDRYRKVAEFYKSYKFDIIIECPWQFWKPDLYPFPELTKTVYDLYVPEYNQFTANGFIVHNSLPKPKSIKCYARKATPEEIENKQDVLGWMFSPNHPEWSPGKVVEGMDQNLNVRAAFLPEHPENGDYVVSCDMCLEAGSPVQTKRGYLGISELKVGDEIYSPQGWVEVIRVMQTGIKKLIKVLPDNGGQALYCTEDHHFPIDSKKIEARNIKASLPSISFYSYNEEIEKRGLTEAKLSMLKMCKTPKEKANYIIANNLKDFFISSLQKYTRANIARWTGTKVSSFGHILDYLGIHKTNKRYAFKVDRFYNNPFIDSSNPTSAYLFGYILGDGNIHERKSGISTLNITSKDKAHLTRIMEIFGKDTKMRKHSRDDKEWWSIDITDQGICKRLKELGISMRKSTEPSYVDFTWIGENFRHFIRGLFDSDGYVRISSGLDLSFVGHDLYIKEIQKRIDGDWGYKYTQSLSYLFLHGRLEQKKFIHAYLYQGATIWLQRKRDIIEQWYLEHFGDIIWPVWNCTVNTPEHLYYANAISTSNCGEELRVVTNLFKEDSWARIINSGGDLHHANSDAIYGEENYTKETRKKAKGAAFGMLYGQEYRGFQRKFPDMSLDEAKEFMIKFKRTIPHIVHGQERMIKEARRTGTFYSGFGRPRRVKHYLTSPDYKDVAFGERTIKNGPIQSTAADVLKLELIRLWDNLFTVYPEYKFIVTIHDEIDVSIPRHLANEIIPKMIRCMTVQRPSDLVPLDCSLSCGPTLGAQYEMVYNFETKEFEPKWEEDKRIETQESTQEETENNELDEEKENIDDSISYEDDLVEEVDSKMFDF